MPRRIVDFCRLPSALVWVFYGILLSGLSFAQVRPELPATPPASFNASDVYFQGYLAARAGEQLAADEDFLAAWEKLERARTLFEAVRRYQPEWKPEMVQGRCAKTDEVLAEIKPKAEAQRQQQRGVIAELEGGERTPVRPLAEQEITPLTPGILEVDPLVSRRLTDAEAEVQRLKQEISKMQQGDTASRALSRLGDMERQRDEAVRKLRAAETNVEALRARLTASPVESEMKKLNQRVDQLEQERQAMGMALSQSRSSHTEALAKAATLEADLNLLREEAATLRQNESTLERDLTKEREISADVVAGQRRQIQSLERALESKSNELANAQAQIASLSDELGESRDAYAQLRNERDLLLLEQEQMKALLNLNHDGRIDDLINQNIDLARQLREASEKVERLNVDNNATKDELSNAFRDLEIAKARIQRLQGEKQVQDERLANLEKRLQNEQQALNDGSANADPEEVAMLREVIKRHLRGQERQRQARQILLDAAAKLGEQDETLAHAIELLEGSPLELSPEEQRLIAGKDVDGEFISPYARDRATVQRATEGLKEEISVFERTAEKAFLAGRLGPTRELFQMILEKHPGHTPTLCKLGVVYLRQNESESAADSFRRAVELDSTNSYAHRMLATSLMSMGDLSAAEPAAARSVELAPDEAKGHILLGVVLHRLGKLIEAEQQYKSAITADPMPSEPYFNLAQLCARNERINDARDYYQQALERGAVPDATLEKRLFKN